MDVSNHVSTELPALPPALGRTVHVEGQGHEERGGHEAREALHEAMALHHVSDYVSRLVDQPRLGGRLWKPRQVHEAAGDGRAEAKVLGRRPPRHGPGEDCPCQGEQGPVGAHAADLLLDFALLVRPEAAHPLVLRQADVRGGRQDSPDPALELLQLRGSSWPRRLSVGVLGPVLRTAVAGREPPREPRTAGPQHDESGAVPSPEDAVDRRHVHD
mmetsp:Transcript_25665/g.73789  ORF Transcript_25665/g.73789 Transcript_25665/m.73789 type:complete len:215 (+) Transcript_25665:700-1344(+)